jgi:hypothetical protein
MIDINAKLENIIVRGHERKRSSKGNEYLIVRIDDMRGKRSELFDPDIENAKYYTMDRRGTFEVEVKINPKYQTMRIVKFYPQEG